LCSHGLFVVYFSYCSIGAALVLNANILPVFDQLGLLERLTEMGFPMAMLDLCKESLKPIGSIDVTDFKEK
jgi:hypothetical protein